MDRRRFLSTSAASATFALARPVFGKKVGSAALTHKQRVDRALRGQDLDRPPFTFYHHYKRPTAQLEAQDHLEFHRTYDTDIVKVMNDFDYPQSTTGKWYELKPLDSPFPDQLATLQLVRDGLDGDAYFIDTIYGPYMTAMILFQSQPQYANLGKSEEVEDAQIKSLHEFQQQNPDAWHSSLEAITQSTINHIRHTKDIGASGALVSIFNAESKFGSVVDYERYTQFKDFNAPVIQYSVKTSGIPISEVRKQYSQPIAGGVDEIDFEKLTRSEMRKQWTEARKEAGTKYIAAPGCSVPNSSTPEELARFPLSLGIDVPHVS